MSSSRASGILPCARIGLTIAVLVALALPGVAAAQGEPDAAEVQADVKEQPADAAPAPPELGDMQRVAAQLGEALAAAQAHFGEALAAAQARLEEIRAAAQAAAERLRAQLQTTSRERDRVAAGRERTRADGAV
jgi:hypothetical protein